MGREICNQDSSAQNQQANLTDNSNQILLYEIRRTRLQHFVTDFFRTFPDSLIAADITSMIKSAQEFADQGDYDFANDLLDESISFFEDGMNRHVNDKSADNLVTTDSPETSSEWSTYVFTGSDFWQQRFNLALGEQDSTVSEGEGNPYLGLRVRTSRGKGSLTSTEGELEIKDSRDYLTGKFLLDHRQQITPALHTLFENRLEATTYRRDSELRYIDDKLNLGAFINVGNSNAFELTHEIQLRDYAHATEFYTSFLQNTSAATFSLVPFGLSRIDLAYEYRNRSYKLHSDTDYNEHRLGFDGWYGLATQLSLYLQVQWRARRYISPEADTLLTKNFDHFYSEIRLRQNLTSTYSLYIDGDVEMREYEIPSSVIPNYLELNLQPSIAISIGAPLSLRVGYSYGMRNHSAAEQEISAVDIEDFVSHGPLVSIDIFSVGGFVCSLSDVYELRRYPNSVSKNISDFSLYSDRNVNSLTLFLSWNFVERWDLDVIANFDHDDDTEDDQGDSRSTLFTTELTYRF